MSKNKEIKEPIIKNRRAVVAIVVLTLAAVITTGVSHCNKYDFNENTDAKYEQSHKDSELDFTVIKNYQGKDYLSIEEEDFLPLIRTAMKEVDEEYVKQGCSPVFDSQDSQFSLFDEYDILGIFKNETDLRLIELKDRNKNMFDTKNYDRFYGEDENGVIYYGPGMMNSGAVDYVVQNDRQQTNGFKNWDKFKIDGKDVGITFENLNPYDYVMQSGAKTKKEIEQALKECIMLNTKCVYVTLNRFVKDYVKAGTHDEELKVLNEYTQFKNLSIEEKQKAFALICYNNGGSVTSSSMMNKTLFDKNNKGEYIINVSYAKKAMDKAADARNLYGYEYSVD